MTPDEEQLQILRDIRSRLGSISTMLVLITTMVAFAWLVAAGVWAGLLD